MQHINSHLALNIHQSLILKSVLLILIFRSCKFIIVLDEKTYLRYFSLKKVFFNLLQ